MNEEYNLSDVLDEHIDYAIRKDKLNPNVADELLKDFEDFIDKLKTRIFRERKFIGKGTYDEPVTLEYLEINRVLDIIDKLSGLPLR